MQVYITREKITIIDNRLCVRVVTSPKQLIEVNKIYKNFIDEWATVLQDNNWLDDYYRVLPF